MIFRNIYRKLQSQAGFGTIGIVGTVAGVATLGIVINNLSSRSQMESAKLMKARSDSLQSNISAFTIAKTLLLPPPSAPLQTKFGTIYPDPYLGGSATKFSVRKSSGDGWVISSGAGNLPVINVRNANSGQFSERHWRQVMQGVTSGIPSTTSSARILGFSRDSSNNDYIRFVDVESSTDRSIGLNGSNPGSNRTFTQKARIEIPLPPNPNCSLDTSQTPDNTSPVNVTGRCNHVVHSARLQVTGPVTEDLNLNVSGFRRINPTVRNLVEKTYTIPGNYSVTFSGRGVDDDPAKAFRITKTFVIYPPCESAGGRMMDGYCYFYGPGGTACNQVCYSKGRRSYNQLGTALANNRSKCMQIMGAFGVNAGYRSVWTGNRAGCKYYGGGFGNGVWTTGSVNGSDPGFSLDRRVCACGQIVEQAPPPSGPPQEGGPEGDKCDEKSGKKIDGFCYFKGGNRQPCNSVCSSRGMRYDGAGTSHANNRNKCTQIMGALGVGNRYRKVYGGNSAGCKLYSGSLRSLHGVWTTRSVNGGDRGLNGDSRVCACK